MRTLFRFALPLALLLILGATFASTARAQNATDAQKRELRQKADAAFNEKSYARAVELYRQVKAAGPSLDEAIINYNISVSLFKMERWDDAIKSANYTLENSDWRARVLYLLGQIYVKVPHEGYLVGGQIYRGDEYPKVEGAEKPELKYLGEEDLDKALEFFESAKIAAQKERADARNNRYFAPIYPITAREEIDLNFDLAAFLSQQTFDSFIQRVEKGGVGASAIDLKQGYDPSWILPHKALYLYAEIRQLDEAKDKVDAQKSLLAEGLFLRAYRARMEGWARKYDEKLKQIITRAYPYNDRNGIDAWRRLVSEYPASELAPQTLILMAQSQQRDEDLIKAAATLRELIQKYTQSKWVSDARAALAEIEEREVSFNLKEATRPGEQPQLSVVSRNLKTVNFAAYKVKLEDYLTASKNLNSYQTRFTEFGENFGTIAEATKKFGAPHRQMDVRGPRPKLIIRGCAAKPGFRLTKSAPTPSSPNREACGSRKSW